MAEEEPVLASAVFVPDNSPPATSPPRDNPSHKRRQSSLSETGSKRPRLSEDNTNNELQDGPPAENTTDRAADRRVDRRRNGNVEERKRGQRLFGALLGTLSQSSSSAASRRRADIEKKQQEKLKLQAEEFDQHKKQKLEDLLVVRRREQKKFDEQSVWWNPGLNGTAVTKCSNRCASGIPTCLPCPTFSKQRLSLSFTTNPGS
ncbi:hypothetical protein IWX92DRAFT_84950 [Phyllosticta citricarpa]